MKLRYAFLIALLLTLVSYNTVTLFTIKEPEREQVTVERVIDGDTLKTTDGRTLRLVNINTPEKNSPLAQEAITFMKQYGHQKVEIEIIGTDKYHRLLAKVYAPDYLNLALVKQGLSSIFLVQKDELTLFAHAEQQAIEAGKGIWRHASPYKCITLTPYAKEEKIHIDCTCYTGSITGWYLKDESRKTYKFTGTCTNYTLWSGSGTDTATDLFWGVDIVWNNDRDSAYLFTEADELVAHTRYGYPW